MSTDSPPGPRLYAETATGGQCRRSVSTRPLCPMNSVPPPPINPYTIFKDPVGATDLVARCRCDFWLRATWYVAPTDRCFSKLCITLFVLLLRPMCPINSVPPPPKYPCNFFKDRVGATNLVARCRCDLWFRATWYVAPTDRCFSKLCITLFVLPLRPMCPINSVPPPPKNPYAFFKDRVGATNLVARKSPLSVAGQRRRDPRDLRGNKPCTTAAKKSLRLLQGPCRGDQSGRPKITPLCLCAQKTPTPFSRTM